VSAPGSVAAATRRYVGLTALRWLPTGLTVPVTVLLMTARGLSPADVGLVFVVHGATVVLLELPTGGLADVLGRRAVLLAGGVLHLAGVLALAGAGGLPGFCGAYLLVAVGRALDSGPLEAWYVDAVHALDPAADTTPGLARAGVANGLALCLGAVLGGVLPALVGDLLALPFLVAAGLQAVHLAAALRLVVPVGAGATPRRGVLATLRAGVADVPGTVATGLRLAAGERVLRIVLALSFATGIVLVTLEVLAPLHIAALAGGGSRGTSVYGVVVALAFAAAGAGAALATRARRAAGGSPGVAMAGLGVLCALCLLGTAVAGTVVPAGLAYCAFYLTNGASWPLRQQLLHDRVGSRQRATLLSVVSLAVQLGGIVGDLLMPRIAQARGTTTAFGVAAGVLLLSAGLSLRLPSGDQEALLDEPLHDGQHLLGGLGVRDPGAAGEHGQQVAEPARPVTAGEQGRAVDVDPA